ncbi:MAG: DNA-3-methyladenine glycosylase [Sandaracinaceae bacterium]
MRPSARVVTLPGPIALRRTLGREKILGIDPTQRRVERSIVCAFRTEEGPATVQYQKVADDRVEVLAWGPGAEGALAGAPEHLGAGDHPERFAPDHPLLGPLAARHGGIRFGATRRVIDHLVPAIIGQKVTGKGASRSYRELVQKHGEPAPGPFERLRIAPHPDRYRELAYFDFHPFGVERKRAQVILDVTRRARRLEALVHDPRELERRLLAFVGIGPWTTALVLSLACGDADAVPVGDYHLKNVVVHALTGRARGTDEEMVELLEPFRPHRGRAIALIAASGVSPPRFGPRMPVRDIRGQ